MGEIEIGIALSVSVKRRQPQESAVGSPRDYFVHHPSTTTVTPPFTSNLGLAGASVASPGESILFFVLTGLASGQPVTLNIKILFIVAKLMIVVEAILTKIEWPTLVVAMLVSNLAVLHQNIRLRAIRTWDRWGRNWRISAFIATGGNEALRSVRVVRAAVALKKHVHSLVGLPHVPDISEVEMLQYTLGDCLVLWPGRLDR